MAGARDGPCPRRRLLVKSSQQISMDIRSLLPRSGLSCGLVQVVPVVGGQGVVRCLLP